MKIKRDAFHAIADPTRRGIIEMLTQQPLHLNAIAENFEVSRQAVSLHVKVLQECGLIVIKKQGRERYCEAQLDKLNEVSDWVAQQKQFWTVKFNALDKYLNKIQTNEKTDQ